MGSGSVCPWASCTSFAPPLRPNLLDSSFINSVRLQPVALVLYYHTVSFPIFVHSFLCSHIPSSFLAILAFICLPISLDLQDSKKRVLGKQTLILDLLKVDSSLLSPCLGGALSLSLPLAQLSLR